ncbi:3-phosphoshikimate 1-carboxyvinyltransferase [Candidatus Uhrbacteria bacterium]|nr:3-phosphoshikimate 1-carboxyvinyltransferase [Candidatus Uhrbacteria bacterium]
MDLIVKNTTRLKGSVTPPGSKSHTIRALLLATLAHGASTIENALDSDDTRACMRVCRSIGSAISVRKDKQGGLSLTVRGKGLPLRLHADVIDTGESGITTRFVLPLLGLANSKLSKRIAIACDPQMRQRPILPFITALNNVGMDIRPRSKRSVWPLDVTGTLEGGATIVDGTTSQYISALLLSLPLAQNDSHITIQNLNERPYVEMTTRWLDMLGIRYEWKKRGGKDHFIIKGGQHYRPFHGKIPADFSSASYFLAAGTILPGQISMRNLDFSDAQGDKELVALLAKMGAYIRKRGPVLSMRGAHELRGARIDCNAIPDLVPTLAVIGTQARGATDLYNVAHARLKETDRLSAMAQELRRLGAHIREKKDGLTITKSKLRGAPVNGHGDHRTIMALAIAGLCAQGTTRIKGAEGIAKTFPRFPKLLRDIGGNIYIIK